MLFKWGLVMAAIFSIAYYFGDILLLKIFTDNSDIISNIQPFLIWVYLIPVLTFGAFIWDGIFIGVTASASMRNAMLISTFIVFVPSYYILHHYFGNDGLWAAFMLFMIARFITLSVLAPKTIFNKI